MTCEHNQFNQRNLPCRTTQLVCSAALGNFLDHHRLLGCLRRRPYHHDPKPFSRRRSRFLSLPTTEAAGQPFEHWETRALTRSTASSRVAAIEELADLAAKQKATGDSNDYYKINWNTIDKVSHVGEDGRFHFYSSKPTLLPTILAGGYMAIKQATLV